MYISKLKIRNYKNFNNVTIDFTKDINTIIGENATGKTNLFYAVRQLYDKNDKHWLDESDFSYELPLCKGHWILISSILKEVPECTEAIELDPDKSTQSAIYTLIFRPRKSIRNQLYILSEELRILTGEEEIISKKLEIDAYINNINIRSDYETIRTVSTIFDFLDDHSYKTIVGDFENYCFPSPDDLQEDKSNIGNEGKTVNDYINVTFIPAIRDVNNELTHENNFFIKILKNISDGIDESKWDEIKNNFGNISNSLQSIQEYDDFTTDVLSTMKETVGNVYSSDIALDVSVPQEKDNLMKYFTLKGKMGDNKVELYNKSLGENNIIYFALKLIQNKYSSGHTKTIFDILLIEEPEAHIHKHLQQTLFSGIKQKNNYQIFISTHSVHISESSNISSMIVLAKKDYHVEVYNPSKNLEEDVIKYLERFLDTTRLPILFSKNVVLVEGTAELIFIPSILKMKYNIDLNTYGISIISMDSCFFENISKLFDEDRLQKKCIILTDYDKDYSANKDCQHREELSKNRIQNLLAQHSLNQFVDVLTNDYTFEIEMFKDNADCFANFITESNIYSKGLDKVISELQSNNIEEMFDRILMIANKLGKGWLALNFISWLEKQDNQMIDAFVLPKYITEMLEMFFNNSLYEKNALQDIIKNYCNKNSLDLEKVLLGELSVNDSFINYLLGQTNE